MLEALRLCSSSDEVCRFNRNPWVLFILEALAVVWMSSSLVFTLQSKCELLISCVLAARS